MKPLLFSIRPPYVAGFFAGTKLYEYRTRRPSVLIGDQLLIYETAPTSLVVASATVQGLITGSPSEVWAKTGEHGGIEREDYDRYFAGRGLAVAIRLEVERLREPLPLPEGMRAPQSWSRWLGEWPLRE